MAAFPDMEFTIDLLIEADDLVISNWTIRGTHTGTAFYDFPTVPDPDAWKNAYRDRLDRAAWGADERAGILTEITAAYRWNTALLEQLS